MIDKIIGKILMAFAEELERFQERVMYLIQEAVPGLSRELLTEWEQDLGLPDECTPLESSVEERAQVAHTKYTGDYTGQSKAFFLDYAARLGAVITIKDYTGIGSVFRVDVNRVDRMPGIGTPQERIYGSRLWNIGSKFKWIITFQTITGDVSRQQIECRIRKLAPAHTELTFR